MHKDIKFNILREGLKNGVSLTCDKYNISRTLYYRWLKRYKAKGIEGLIDIKKTFTPANKTSDVIEEKVFSLIQTYPRYGPRAIKYLLEEFSYDISESAVYNVMKRNNLTTKESRTRFSKKKESQLNQSIPPLKALESGECWIFWITDYGYFEHIGHIYEYTLIDYKSRIACSRLYNTITFTNFEDLLAAVAIPVARSLHLITKYLCFFQDGNSLKQSTRSFKSQINHTILDNGLDVQVHLLTKSDDLELINDLRQAYTRGCLTFLLPHIHKQESFEHLKILFQSYIRNYNMSDTFTFDTMTCSPVDYHSKLTGSKLILPLWAYMDRDY